MLIQSLPMTKLKSFADNVDDDSDKRNKAIDELIDIFKSESY